MTATATVMTPMSTYTGGTSRVGGMMGLEVGEIRMVWGVWGLVVGAVGVGVGF